MISDLVIDKLHLSETNITIGESYRNNCSIYLWDDIKIEGIKVYIMDCSIHGRPFKDNMLNIYCTGRDWFENMLITEDIILKDTDLMKKYIISWIDKNIMSNA